MAAAPLIVAGALAAIALARAASTSKAVTRPSSILPAREMSPLDARKELDRLVKKGDVRPLGTWGTDPTSRLDAEGVLAGVEFTYLGSRIPIRRVDPRFLVFLTRLATMLKTKFSASSISHLGIYPSKDPASADVHNQGRAIDLSDVVTPSASVQVLRDWGQKSKTSSGFRLPPSETAGQIFSAIYNLAAREATDRSTSPFPRLPPSKIGDSSYILTPDHPNPKYALDHRNHMHLQIGPTLGPDPLMV